MAYRLGVPILLLLFAYVADRSIREKSTAYDEIFHLTGGYSYWETNDYRIHPTNGNLIQRFIAAPLLLMNVEFPSTNQNSWWTPKYHGMKFGDQFFHSVGNDVDAMLRAGRRMVILLGVALGIVVHAWSRQLFGRRGALVSLALFCFSPTILAHGRLATSDLAAALALTLAVWTLWRAMHRLSARYLLASCSSAGLLAVVKFSAPLLVFMAIPMALLRLWRGGALPIEFGPIRLRVTGRGGQMVALLLLGVALLLAVWLVVWACYGFRYAAAAPDEKGPARFGTKWDEVMSMENRTAANVITAAKDHRLFPEAYLYGLAHTLKYSEARATYLRGKCSMVGWWYFYPYCFLVKSSLAVLALLLLSVATFVFRGSAAAPGGHRFRKLRRDAYRTAPLWILLAVYWTAAIRSNLNLGIRHLLPIYPAVFILCGATGYWFDRNHRFRKETGRFGANPKICLFILALLGFHVVESLRMHPNYLPYFNQLIGGPKNGHRHLVDHNLDWGQDLPGLARWLKERGYDKPDGPAVYFHNSGTGSPEYYGMRRFALRAFLINSVSPMNPLPLSAGIYCVGATTEAGPNEDITRWTPRIEAGYRRALVYLRALAERYPNGAVPDDARIMCQKIGYMQFARLLAYFRQIDSDDHINYSIHIYYLDDRDIAAALLGPIEEAGRESR